MEPKRILVNSDEYKTKGVFLYADDNCNLYLDEECTCAVTGEQLKDYFLLNAIIVHNGIMHLANNLIFGSKGGAKIAAIGSDLVFTSSDFEGDDEVWTLTWDGNTEGLEAIEQYMGTMYRVSSEPPSGDYPYINCVAYGETDPENIVTSVTTRSMYAVMPGVGSVNMLGYLFGNGSGEFSVSMLVLQDDINVSGLVADRGVYVTEIPEGCVLSITALNSYATFEWDGNTEGRVVYDNEFYHVSDTVPNIAEDDMARGSFAVNGGLESATAVVELLDETNGVSIYRINSNLGSGAPYFGIILTGEFTSPNSGYTFPAGVYMYRRDNSEYIARLDLYKE